MTTYTVTPSPIVTSASITSPSVPPCSYFSGGFKSEPDACAIGVLAAVCIAAITIVLAIVLMLVGIVCCCKPSLRKKQRAVQRTKPLVAIQAASWLTSSLTSKPLDLHENHIQAIYVYI